MLVHGYAAAPEADPLHFQAESLFERRGALQPDSAPGSQHALPRQGFSRLPQNLNHLAVIQRVASRGGHLRVSCNLTSRNPADHTPDGGIAVP